MPIIEPLIRRRVRATLSRASVPLLYLLLASAAPAQDLEPRTYYKLPVGQNFFAAGYAYSDGELSPSPSVPVRDIELTMKTTAVGYVRTLDLWGNSGSVKLSWARVCLEGSGFVNDQFASADRCGTVDPGLRVAYMFYGAPAMDMETFRSTPAGRVVGASLEVRAPLGDYNNENVINSGGNRWTFKPEIGISNRWSDRWSVDAAFAARLFSDNDNFNRGVTLEQDPLYQLQVHLIYDLPRGRWLSLNGNYFWGGETSQDGVRLDDRQENSRLGITLAWPLTAQQSLKLYASRGVITNIGNDSDTVGALWQYRWE